MPRRPQRRAPDEGAYPLRRQAPPVAYRRRGVADRCRARLVALGRKRTVSDRRGNPPGAQHRRCHRRRRPPARRPRRRVFLPQALRGAYQEVDISVVGIRSGPLRIERVDARLYDVRVPFRDVVLRDIRRVGIGRSDDVISLRFQDLEQLLRDHRREVRLARTDDGQVRMRGFFSVLGQTVQATADVDLSVDGNQLRITPGDIDTAGASLQPCPSASAPAAADLHRAVGHLAVRTEPHRFDGGRGRSAPHRRRADDHPPTVSSLPPSASVRCIVTSLGFCRVPRWSAGTV